MTEKGEEDCVKDEECERQVALYSAVAKIYYARSKNAGEEEDKWLTSWKDGDGSFRNRIIPSDQRGEECGKFDSYFKKYKSLGGMYYSRLETIHSIITEKGCQPHGFTPPLIASIIWTESHFNPAAVSPKGAIGLMQMLPDTGRDEFGITNPETLKDPEENIEKCTIYLSRLLHRFQNLDKAIGGYNVGPSKVIRGVPKRIMDSFVLPIMRDLDIFSAPSLKNGNHFDGIRFYDRRRGDLSTVA